jgi:hypothetical protein
MQFTELWDNPSSMEICLNFISDFNEYSKIEEEFRAAIAKAITVTDNTFLKFLLKPLPNLTPPSPHQPTSAAVGRINNWPSYIQLIIHVLFQSD